MTIMSRRPAFAVVFAALALSFSFAVAGAETKAADWPQFRGPNRDDRSPDTDLLKEWPKSGPPLVWKATGLGEGFATVAVTGGKIYTMGDQCDSCYVVAIDEAAGKKLWATPIGKSGKYGGYEGPRGTPTVDGDLLFVIGQHGDLACLGTADGQIKWQKSLAKDFGGQKGGWAYAESPLVDGDKLICTPGGKTATLTALDKRTGAVVWKAAVPKGGAAGYSSIVISEAAGKRQYVQLLAAGVVGVAADDGKFLWYYDRFAGNTANIPTPIVQGDLVFSAAGYGRGGGLLKLTSDGAGGVKFEEVYFNKDLQNKHGGVVLVGEYLYGDRDDSGHPYCARLADGKVMWQRKENRPGNGSAAVTYADGHLYFRYQNGVVALVEATPEKYKEISSFKIPDVHRPSWPHPVVIGGRLYLREQDNLFCYDVKQKAAE